MKIPVRLTKFLNAAKVGYQVIHHPLAFTAQELTAMEGIKGKYHAKVVIALAGGLPVMLVLPATHQVDLRKVEQLLDKQVTLATEAQFQTLFPDCAVGTMPPFGHLYGVISYVDRSLADHDFVVFEAGTHTDAIRLAGTDFLRLAQATVADIATKLH